LCIQIAHRNFRPLFGQQQGHGSADAAAGASHNRHPIFEHLFHHLSLFTAQAQKLFAAESAENAEK
jgi:hypothetical protein